MIIDESIPKEDTLMFFRLINERYEKKSTIVTTNADFKYWGDIFSYNTLASAILDRLLLRIKKLHFYFDINKFKGIKSCNRRLYILSQYQKNKGKIKRINS